MHLREPLAFMKVVEKRRFKTDPMSMKILISARLEGLIRGHLRERSDSVHLLTVSRSKHTYLLSKVASHIVVNTQWVTWE